MAEPTWFQDLPKTVQKGFRLLKRVAKKAIKGLDQHYGESCPIHYGYGIFASSKWGSLDDASKKLLRRKGWNWRIYNETLNWYDVVNTTVDFLEKRAVREQRKESLKTYLKSK